MLCYKFVAENPSLALTKRDLFVVPVFSKVKQHKETRVALCHLPTLTLSTTKYEQQEFTVFLVPTVYFTLSRTQGRWLTLFIVWSYPIVRVAKSFTLENLTVNCLAECQWTSYVDLCLPPQFVVQWLGILFLYVGWT